MRRILSEIDWLKWRWFLVALFVLLLDRFLGLWLFGFKYTDVDQLILWNGVVDYADGVFHEPYFYGQTYNFMLEALLGVPMHWLGIPFYYSLPIISSTLAILPFVVMAFLLTRHQALFWGVLCILLPVILPLEYTLMTSMPRGWLQAHAFIPLTFFWFFNPDKRVNLGLLVLGGFLAVISNPSAVITLVPIGVIALFRYYKSRYFYLFFVLLSPILLLPSLASKFYEQHPEMVINKLFGLQFDPEILSETLTNGSLFSFLSPMNWHPLWVYGLLIGILLILAWKNGKRPELFALIALVGICFVSFCIPKVQENIPCTSFYYSSSRFYLLLPLIVLFFFYLNFRDKKIGRHWVWGFTLLSLTVVPMKYFHAPSKIAHTIETACFPAVELNTVLERHRNLEEFCRVEKIDLVINSISFDWHVLRDDYAYYPLTKLHNRAEQQPYVIMSERDRRTWLYKDVPVKPRVLLHGFIFERMKLDSAVFVKKSKDRVILTDNNLNLEEILDAYDLRDK